jgi:hypothetical protein
MQRILERELGSPRFVNPTLQINHILDAVRPVAT